MAIKADTLIKLKILTEINSLTLEEVDVYWLTLRTLLNGYNDDIQYAEDEINDENLIVMLLAEDIILKKNGLWGDTLQQHEKNYQRYLNTLTGLGA